MNLSPHFTLEEFTHSDTAIAHGIDNQPNVIQLANMRRYLAPGAERTRIILRNNPILISSGLRISELNAVIPGSSNTSAHTLGYAMDFTCPGFGSPWEICHALVASDLQFDQLIYESVKNRYGGLTIWVHLSFDPRNRRLVMTKLPGQGYRSGLHQEAA